MTSCNHVVKEYCSFTGGSPSKQVTTLVKFGGHRFCKSGDLTLLDCHMTLYDHILKGHMTRSVGFPP